MIPPPLFKHQEEAVEFILRRGGIGALFMDCGTGKTRAVIETFRRLRVQTPGLKMLVISPLSLLNAAWGEDIKKFSSMTYMNLHDEGIPENDWKADIWAINYESMIAEKNFKKIHSWLYRYKVLLVADECFNGNTLVDTPKGKIKIKDIKIGDKIINCSGIDTVIGTRIKKLDTRIKIKYNNSWIECSLNHPFFTDSGWKAASNLKKGDKLVTTNFSMSLVRKNFYSERPGSEILRDILLGEMEDVATRNKEKNFHAGNGEKDIKRGKHLHDVPTEGGANTHGKAREYDALAICEKKSIGQIKDDGMEAYHTRRERKTSSNPPEQIIKAIRKNVGSGISSSFKGISKKRLSKLLQDRHSQYTGKNRDRSRWGNSSWLEEDFGREKNKNVKFIRVEDIKIFEQRSDGKRAGSVKKNIFYDLKIKNHPSFSINGVLVHNSSRMKNFKSKTTERLITLRDRAMYRIIMSGTPAPNSPLEYWGQMEFLHRGMLHPSFYAFRNSFFHLARGKQVVGQGVKLTREAMRDMLKSGFKYEITDANRKKLMDRIRPACYWAKKEDCLDLPDQVDEIREVELGPLQRKAYRDLKNHLIAEIQGADITAQNALTKLLKLREVTSGFAYDGMGQEHDVGESAKLTELNNVIEDLGGQQVIVWANFKWEIEKIKNLLTRYGKTVTLFSGTEDRDTSIKLFQSGEAQYLCANTHSSAHGLTFVNCSTQIFFSFDYSYETYEQAKARIHRAGQTKKCTYIHLVARDTIDQDILKVLKYKGNMNEVLYKMVSSK